MAISGICNSAKVEVLFGGHCFAATRSNVACVGAAGAYVLTGLAIENLTVGMAASGTNVAPGAVIAAISNQPPSNVKVTLSLPHTGAVTAVTFTGDQFNALLIKDAPSRVYDATQTNVGTPGVGLPSAASVGTDEVTGAGYTSYGLPLNNIDPSLPGNPAGVATTQFSPDPTWVGASFSTTAVIIANMSMRMAPTTGFGRTYAIFDLGGTQTVTNGVFTILQPVNDGTNALIRIQ